MTTPVPDSLGPRAAAGIPLVCFLLSCLVAPCKLTGQAPADTRAVTARLESMERKLDAQERELEEYRSALATLRRQVDAMTGAQAGANAPAADVSALRQAVTDLRDEQSVQQSEIAVHEQAKVETRSRYNLKVGGLVLFNAFQNDGSVDSIDVPVIALSRPPGQSHGSEGATIRQSLITLDATGPRFWGAHTYANVQMDFFGGLSTSDYTTTSGTLRMRAASVETAWPTWRVHAGLERLLVAPSSPTSFASIGEPAMAWSGNLWAWIPQLAAEKRWTFTDTQQLSLAGAVADIPDPGPGTSQYERAPSAAENSRYPGSELRAGYAWGRAQPGGNAASSIGASGYFSPHNYGTSGRVDSWAALGDWNIVLPAGFALSGSAYKGQALGGLGGGTFKDVLSEYDYKQAKYVGQKMIGLRDEGGWAQLKYKIGSRFEFNGAFGMDNSSAGQLWKSSTPLTNPYSTLARNQTFMGNAIFRPRASFLLSLEYRKLKSWPLTSTANEANIVGLAAGYEF